MKMKFVMMALVLSTMAFGDESPLAEKLRELRATYDQLAREEDASRSMIAAVNNLAVDAADRAEQASAAGSAGQAVAVAARAEEEGLDQIVREQLVPELLKIDAQIVANAANIDELEAKDAARAAALKGVEFAKVRRAPFEYYAAALKMNYLNGHIDGDDGDDLAAEEMRNTRFKQGAGAIAVLALLADLGIGAYKANKGFKKLSKEDRKLMKFLSMMLNEMYTVKGVKAAGRLVKRGGLAAINGTKSFFSNRNRARIER